MQTLWKQSGVARTATQGAAAPEARRLVCEHTRAKQSENKSKSNENTECENTTKQGESRSNPGDACNAALALPLVALFVVDNAL